MAETVPGLEVTLDYFNKINLALEQSTIPLADELVIVNRMERPLRDITVEFSADPVFFTAAPVHIAELEADGEFRLRDWRPDFSFEFFTALSDRAAGTLKLKVKTAEENLFEKDFPVEIHAADQWFGCALLPELLASFVLPNQRVISELMPLVSGALARRGLPAALEGYQSGDRTRVYRMVLAVYDAIRSLDIVYSNPPASFGALGQRVRFPDAVVRHRLGTCLDLALLFAALLEQCGLHPVLLLQQGHAYVGCHLKDAYFEESPLDDLQTVRKRSELDEFVVLETTCCTQGGSDAASAELAARLHLLEDEKFICAVDVVRARKSGLLPLPLARSVDGFEFSKPEPLPKPGAAGAVSQERELRAELAMPEPVPPPESASGRVLVWQQKLLDLSLRNRLLNARETRQLIPIACLNPARVEDALADGASFSVNPLEKLLSAADYERFALSRGVRADDRLALLLDSEFRYRRIWAPVGENDLSRRLVELYRDSRNDLEEGGVNTLFLAIGFLEWMEAGGKTSHLAPLLLMPVRLARKSAQSGVTVTRTDEDTMLNVTLLELLRRDFELDLSMLDPLPADDSGVDVDRVLQLVRQAVRDLKGWEVHDYLALGRFSFNKFIMWNDLARRTGELCRNPAVAHLVSGESGEFDAGIEPVEPGEVEALLKPESLYCPLSADSSQLAAVLLSERGKSFVLHGPPGTGKSQTIANLVAHNLALGRRVLFVSEKRAALEVVYRRLESIGLGPFCLELHSNKSGKADVLKQFRAAVEFADRAEPADWGLVAGQLAAARAELNGYVAELHRKYPAGFSLYDAFSRLLGNDSPEELPAYAGTDPLALTPEEYGELRRIASGLGANAGVVSAEARRELATVGPVEWTPAWEKELLKAAGELRRKSEALRGRFERAGELFGFTGAVPAEESVYQAAVLAQALKGLPELPAGFAGPEFGAVARDGAEWFAAGRERDELTAKLSGFKPEPVDELDFAALRERIAELERRFFIVRFFGRRALAKEFAALKRPGAGPLGYAELAARLDELEQLQEKRRIVAGAAPALEGGIGKQWNNGAPAWEELEKLTERGRELQTAFGVLSGGEPARLETQRRTVGALLGSAPVLLGEGGATRREINAFLNAWNEFEEALAAFENAAGAPLPGRAESRDVLSAARRAADGVERFHTELRRYTLYARSRDAAEQAGLGALAAALDAGAAPERTEELLELSLRREVIDRIIDRVPCIREFLGSGHEAAIGRFRELDERYTRLSRDIVVAKLAARLPRRRQGPCPEGSELGLLKRECEKRARHKAVRTLLGEIPNLLPLLKPCFLMSPLSVAQYLPAELAQFDLIVFDEASQIPVWDAVGAIARGRQLIVVGDPKQMPPTSFFQRQEAEGEFCDEDEAGEEPESILNECIAAGFHSAYLNWHYRSRHESLIAFSNRHYYENRLFTFPSARGGGDLGVKFRFVPDGVYERRRSRSNRAEAECVVREVFERLKRDRRRSIGVGTFSMAQQQLIEDLIDAERRSHPQFDGCFDDSAPEPVFVKNLENVQGDERDVIIFSICYARDREGKLSMNFGPLNRQGGERRLNVAITRAREEVLVISSIRDTDIDLGRTRATGAAHLKYFLQYAERNGEITLPGAAVPEQHDGFVETVAKFLEENGFRVKRRIGYSGCRIDLGVLREREGADFALGIECDGPGYAASAASRDRVRLRDSVLAGLGWRLSPVWSTGWWLDPERSRAELLAAVEQALNAPPEPESEPAPESEPELRAEPAPEIIPAVSAVNPREKIYRAAAVTAGNMPVDRFYESAGMAMTKKLLEEIVEAEGPILEPLLCRRAVKAWGFARSGETIRRVLEAVLPSEREYRGADGETVYWPVAADPAEYGDYRVPGEDGERRDLDEIPLAELANAMRAVTEDFQCFDREPLFRETVRRFGFAMLSAKMKPRLEQARELLHQEAGN